jgi:hypothetical protein
MQVKTLLRNAVGCLAALLLAAAGQVKADIIYVADVVGHVGRFDTKVNKGDGNVLFHRRGVLF